MRAKIELMKKARLKKRQRKRALNCNLFSPSESTPTQLAVQLTEEISNFTREVNEFQEQQVAFNQSLLAFFTEQIQNYFSQAVQVQTIGSVKTGLNDSSSNLNIQVICQQKDFIPYLQG